MILHNSIRVAQNLSRRNSHAQTKLGDMPSLNNRVRLTYGHCNPLKLLQTAYLQSAQNILNLLNLRNYRVTRELANLLIISRNANGESWSNSLNRLDYNESLESAGNKHEQYSGSPEHQHCLGSAIIFKGCIKENQQRAVEVPTNNAESCNGSAFLLYEGNQQRTVLYRNPDLAYERVVTQSYEVNQLSLSESDNKPSLRGEALISAVPHSANEISPVQEKRKGGISNPTLWLVVYRQTTENPAVHSITESNPVQLSGSDLAFLRWRRLISHCMAVTINWAVLSPCSLTCSIASTTSCGARVCNFCDFSFFVPVAITKSPDIKWSTEYQKKNEIKHLKWIPLCIYSGVHLEGVYLQDIAKPGSARTLTGPLTTKIVNVSRQL